MLDASFRELQTHAQKVRAIIAIFNEGGAELTAVCVQDKFGKGAHIRVGDDYDGLASGESRFATHLPGVLGKYFEVWQKTNDEKYTLCRAYLHLHASAGPSEPTNELLFLHTEPLSPETGADAKQQRIARWQSGPHIHLKASHYGLGRCHIHLDSCTVPCSALQSLSAYRESLQNMIEMLVDELTQYFDPAQFPNP
jgi:hypothetical protein